MEGEQATSQNEPSKCQKAVPGESYSAIAAPSVYMYFPTGKLFNISPIVELIAHARQVTG